jgi:hypothetical protein
LVGGVASGFFGRLCRLLVERLSTTDYNPGDVATLLQSGGIELLDVKTLTVLRQLESTIRGDLSRLTHFEKLSDELIAPNLDQDISFFYDPTTKNCGSASRSIQKPCKS